MGGWSEAKEKRKFGERTRALGGREEDYWRHGEELGLLASPEEWRFYLKGFVIDGFFVV